MKKLNQIKITNLIVIMLVVSTAFFFSCTGGGNNNKNVSTQDSTVTTKAPVNDAQSFNSFEFCKNLAKDKKFANENFEKTVLLTDLLVQTIDFESTEFKKGSIIVYAFDPKNKKVLFMNSHIDGLTFKGKKINNEDGKENYLSSLGDICIQLSNMEQVKTLNMFDATQKTVDIGAKFQESIKVKGTIKYIDNRIILDNAEIIK